MNKSYHKSVLLEETVAGLNIKPDGVYVDVTFGGGGHSREILKHLEEKGRLVAFDQDVDAQRNALDDERFLLIPQNFRYLKRYLRFYGIKQVDGILGDFGVSSHQFDQAERGFSIRFDAELDMRMNQDSHLSAYHVVNEYGQDDLRRIFSTYGELRQAPKMARLICEKREEAPIISIDSLKKVLSPCIDRKKEHKILAQVFQAIRIEVNQEIEVLKDFLLQTPEVLKKEGRLSLISYHSLEDRLVKRFIRDGMFEGQPDKDLFGNVDVPFKKVGGLIVPTQEEINQNNRARSAKLRIAVKL